jgi:hypothetical protein
MDEPALTDEGRVPRVGQVAGGVEHPAKQRLQVQLGDDRPPDLEQLLESLD